MKPDNWDDMDKKTQDKFAANLRMSMRGRLIMGQALANAIKAMRQEPYPEQSNIEDMEVIGLTFEPWFSLYLNDMLKANVQ